MLKSPTEQPALVEIDELYWNAQGKPILEKIRAQVCNNEFVGLIGPNGSGKTSLLRVLYRYLEPSSGDVRFDGEVIASIHQSQYAALVSVVLQESPRQIGLSVRQVVELGLIPQRSLFDFQIPNQDKVNRALDMVGLLQKASDSFDALSGGEKQRCMIARALIQDPKLLILDEPTNHLDIHYQLDILNIIKKLNTTVLASIHDLNIAMKYCDRVIVLDQGRVADSGIPQEVLTPELLRDVFQVNAHIGENPTDQSPYIFYQHESVRTEAALTND